jgi:hypothetical protein
VVVANNDVLLNLSSSSLLWPGMAFEEVDLPDAGHEVVRCMKRQKKGTTHPEIIDAGMAVVVGAVMVEIQEEELW